MSTLTDLIKRAGLDVYSPGQGGGVGRSQVTFRGGLPAGVTSAERAGAEAALKARQATMGTGWAMKAPTLSAGGSRAAVGKAVAPKSVGLIEGVLQGLKKHLPKLRLPK